MELGGCEGTARVLGPPPDGGLLRGFVYAKRASGVRPAYLHGSALLSWLGWVDSVDLVGWPIDFDFDFDQVWP